MNVKKIADYRRMCNMTQEELAEKVGVAVTTVSMWERCERLPRLPVLVKITSIFGCRFEDLIENN